MENTLDPQIIYDVFNRREMTVARIDHFDRGDYAEIRIDLSGEPKLSPTQLLKLATRLKVIEDREKITVDIVHLDMPHHTIRINIRIGKREHEPADEESTATFPKKEIGV